VPNNNSNAPAHQPLIDEVLRKVGRNLIIFQQVEGMIRVIGSTCRSAGLARDLPKALATASREISKQPMGKAASLTLKKFFGDSDATPPPDDLQEVWISISIGVDRDPEFEKQLRNDIAAAVRERNKLAHHFLSTWQMSSIESCYEASAVLDEQRARVLPLHATLKGLVEGMASTGRALLESDALEQLLSDASNELNAYSQR
jgi:hypothetical protein